LVSAVVVIGGASSESVATSSSSLVGADPSSRIRVG
jgi:hypothetical protein